MGLTPSATILRTWGDRSRTGLTVFETLTPTAVMDGDNIVSLQSAPNGTSFDHGDGAIRSETILNIVDHKLYM